MVARSAVAVQTRSYYLVGLTGLPPLVENMRLFKESLGVREACRAALPSSVRLQIPLFFLSHPAFTELMVENRRIFGNRTRWTMTPRRG
jgi:hypothetical protein